MGFFDRPLIRGARLAGGSPPPPPKGQATPPPAPPWPKRGPTPDDELAELVAAGKLVQVGWRLPVGDGTYELVPTLAPHYVWDQPVYRWGDNDD